MNKVILIGRIGKDPEVKNLTNGIVANFSLATSERYKQDGEKKEVTDWHNCVAYGIPAELITKYVHKGDMIAVEGKIKTRSYEAKNDKRYITEIIVNQIEFLATNAKHGEVNGNVAEDGNDLPF